MRLLLILPTHTYQAAAYVEAAQRLEIDLTVASEVDSTFSARDNPAFLTLDLCDPPAAAERAAAFAAAHEIAGVMGVDDRTTVVAAHVARRLGLPYSPTDAVEAAGNKHLQRRRLAAAGVRVPAFQLVDLAELAAARTVSFPVVVKPLDLSASRGVIRANDEAELRRAQGIIREIVQEAGAGTRVLVEEYVPGAEYAVEGAVIDGRFVPIAVFEKPDPLDGPFFEETIYLTPPRIPDTTLGEIVAGVAAAIRALGLTRGPVHAEVRVNENGVWLIECAARPIGGKCGRVLSFGSEGETSLEELHLALALGLRRDVPERASDAAGVMMIPIPAAGTLRSVAGVENAMAVRHVTDVMVTMTPGTKVRRLPYESRYLGFVFATAPTPDRVEHALREAHAALRIDIAREAP